MQAVIATEFHIEKKGEKYYTKTQFFTILYRYYNSFGKLKICSRFKEIDEISNSLIEITDILVDVLALNSLERSMLHLYDKDLKNFIFDCDLVICRVPSIIAYRTAECAKYLRKYVLVELMGDAWDSYWNHGVHGKIIAPYMYEKMKHIVKYANYALYVTEFFLQKKYPCNNESIAASNVLVDEFFNEVIDKRCNKIKNMSKKELVLMTVASVDIRHKGQQFVIQAIPRLNSMGIKVKYMLVGGGDQRYLKNIAEKHNVSEQIVFVGRLKLKDVFVMLDETDLYLQPSLQEGLPRAMIEAMSRGCPCIGARTAGIPELIDEEFIAKRKSSRDIVKKILSFNNMSSEDKQAVAKINFMKAKKYSTNILDERRNKYFEMICNQVSANKK